jgi:hypothetical protein
MAYDFVRATSQRIAGALSSIAVPLTLHARIFFDNVTTSNQAVVSVDTVGGNNRHVMQITQSGAMIIVAISNSGAGNQTALGSAVPSNDWSSGVAQYSATNNRRPYIDGSAGTANTGSATVTFDQLLISATTNTTATNNFDGKLADIAVWDVALTDAEIVSLAKGFKPYRIRPQSLRTYVPLIRNLQDVRGVVSLTANNGPTVADHPRVY